MKDMKYHINHSNLKYDEMPWWVSCLVLFILLMIAAVAAMYVILPIFYLLN